MKLIFIYGPPASGKLTVAKALSKITGYKIFHNQLTVDLLSSLLKFGTESYFNFSNKIRIELIGEAARQKVPGIIFTFCYAYKLDDKFVKKIISKVKKHGGEVHFVQLYCDNQKLHKRVKNPSRLKHKKIKHISKLKKTMARYDLLKPIPFVESLTIDNSNLSATKTAQKIKKHFKLK